MRLIAFLTQRLADWRRERRIRWLCAAYCSAMAAGRPDFARRAWDLLRCEIEDRSPEQVARMERGKGLRA